MLTTELLKKAPILIIILIAVEIIFWGVEGSLFGISGSYLSFILGGTILFFVFIYYKFLKNQ